jgi:TPR repeat protein
MKHISLLAFTLIGILSFLGCTSAGSLQKGKSASLDYDSMMRMDFAKIEALAQKGNPVAQYVMAEFYLWGTGDPQPDKEIGISWLKKTVKTGVGVPLFPDNPFMDRMVGRSAMMSLVNSCENEQDFIKYNIAVDRLADSLSAQYKIFIDSAFDSDLKSRIEALNTVYQGADAYWIDSKGKEKILWIIKPNPKKAKELHKSILASVQKGVPEKDYELMRELSQFYSHGFPAVKEGGGSLAMPEIAKPDKGAGVKWEKKATQVATELAKSGDAKAIKYLFVHLLNANVESDPEAWLTKAMEKLADKGDVEAMDTLTSFLSFDKPADALVWHRIHGALTRLDPSWSEEFSSSVYKELSAEQIAVAAQKAKRWLEANPEITKHSDFLRIVSDADLETLDKDGNRIQKPRMAGSGKALEGITVLKGLEKPFTGKVRGSGGRPGWRIEVNFLKGKVHGRICLWDQKQVKRNEMIFKQGRPVSEKQWFQDGRLASEKRWDNKGNLIPSEK